ncbi:hypothetical protein MXD81_54940, partial [Microbacteriaceae bacterium K1510]|nr:hypothetical protein [Microbacteriaceae bacterium K1510]
MKKKDSKVTIAFASTGLLGLAALIGFFLDAKLIGFVTGVLALLSFFIGLGRQAGAHRKVGETEQEQIWSENGQNLLQPHEVERLRAEQRQNGVELTSHEAALASLLAEWQAGSWEEFLARREQALTEQHQKETDRLSGALQEQQEKDQIIAEWADKVREFLQLRKTQINKRRDALKQEIRQVEELTGNLREQIAKANGEAGRSDQHSWAKARSEYEEAAAALDELLLKRESLVLAKETLRCALHDWQREMSPDVNRFASAIMAEITGGSYRDVRLDPLEKFSVRAIDPRHQKVVEHHQVSSGTQDQLY